MQSLLFPHVLDLPHWEICQTRICSVVHVSQELKRSSRRRSRPLGVPQTITVTKGPKVCHLAWVIHSNCGQHSQKSDFWVKIYAPETGKLHFPPSMTLSSFSREVLTMTAWIRELVDANCIYLCCNFASWQSKASTCVGLEEYFSRSNTSRPHHIPAFSGTQLSADNWIISSSVCAPVLNCARKESFWRGEARGRRAGQPEGCLTARAVCDATVINGAKCVSGSTRPVTSERSPSDAAPTCQCRAAMLLFTPCMDYSLLFLCFLPPFYAFCHRL